MPKKLTKTIAIIFAILGCTVFALAQPNTGTSQLNLNCQNEPLRNVLKQISNQTNMKFVFCDFLVDGEVVTCDLKNTTVEQGLAEILSNLDIAFKFYPNDSVVLFKKQRVKPKITKKENIRETIQPPLLRNKIKPGYPKQAENEGLEGRVNLSLLVDENGDVKVSKVTRSSSYEILDKAAIEYSHQLKFEPATKKGVPTVVWVSWSVNFKSPETEFFQCDYIYKLQNLYKLAELNSGEKRNEILHNIILIHNDCIEYLKNKPEVDFNEIIKQVVLPDIYDEWQDLWKEWHLHFVVFQDFLVRYPNSVLTTQAIADMLNHLDSDLAHIKSIAKDSPHTQKKIDFIIKLVDNFLNENYPKSNTKNFLSQIETKTATK